METIKLNITQLNTIVKRIIDAEEFLQTLSVYGEVSNFKISGNNAYFDIKENGAQLACVMFGCGSLDINNGDMVLLTGKLNFYIKTGKLSFVANKIEPYGIGDLYKKYLELKEKLTSQGLFDSRYKKQLPRFANCVGVVTSETGAVIRDICSVAKKKNPYTDIIVYPAKVQGINAEQEIINGLRYFENTNVDVVIIARGGGSFEDLSPFNTEILAREIFACNKPIISAVGHETDFSLSDFVADMRAPTPSVAAELAFFDYNSVQNNIKNSIQSILDSTTTFIVNNQNKIIDTSTLIAGLISNIKDKQLLLLNDAINSNQKSFDNYINNAQSLLEKTMLSIEKLNPLSLLKNGYSIIEKQGGRIQSVNDVNNNDIINVIFADGKIEAKVTKKEN